MIASEQERDALMAAIEEYGQARADTESAGERVSYEAAIAEQKIAEQRLAAIRAMLAPGDAVLRDAIAIVRANGLVFGTLEDADVDVDTRTNEVKLPIGLALVRVLRGEETRDE